MSPPDSDDGSARREPRSDSLPICKLRMVPPLVRRRLTRLGITRCDQLLEAVRRAGDVATLVERLDVTADVLRNLVDQADLSRIVGLGNGFARLLEGVGIRTSRDLARIRPRELWRRLDDHNRRERICRRTPNPDELRSWIAQARRLQMAAIPS